MRRRTKTKTLLLHQVIRILRWIFILSFLVFVAIGWFRSGKKYLSGQTSTTIVKNETERFTYPSLSICPKFKGEKDLIKHMIKPAMIENNLTTFDELDFEKLIEPFVWKRDEIFQVFGQAEHGHPAKGRHMLYNDSYWVNSIPHVQYTGQCFTFHPPYTSKPGLWHGLRTGIKFNTSEELDQDQNEKLLHRLQIFFHNKGDLFYYKEDYRPSHNMLDMSKILFGKENQVEIKFSSYRALNSDQRPCTYDPDYDMLKCIETYYSEKRGCQPPWSAYSDVNIPLCNDLNDIIGNFSRGPGIAGHYYTLPFQTTIELARTRGCPVPCTTSRWEFDVSYKDQKSWMNYMDGESELIIYFWFRNFFFQYEKEYLVCDYTCLIGEIGGNLGFFLGGSVLTYMDLLLQRLVSSKLL